MAVARWNHAGIADNRLPGTGILLAETCSITHSLMPMPRHALSYVTFALLLGLASMSPRAAGQTPEPRVIEVVAKRFAFEPAVIDVTAGEPVRLLVRSADGPHGFQVKKFKIGKEIPRGGEPVTIDFTPNVPGRFPILCSEYCGDGHDDMKGTLVVSAH
jgi:cytochrome c oxidase subunit 2